MVDRLPVLLYAGVSGAGKEALRMKVVVAVLRIRPGYMNALAPHSKKCMLEL